MDTLHAHIATGAADWLESKHSEEDAAYIETEQALDLDGELPPILYPEKDHWYRPWRLFHGASFFSIGTQQPFSKADAASMNWLSHADFMAQSVDVVTEDSSLVIDRYVYVPMPAAITERPKPHDDLPHLSEEEIAAARQAVTGTMVHRWTTPRENKAVRSLRARLSGTTTRLQPSESAAPTQPSTPSSTPAPPVTPAQQSDPPEPPRLHPSIPPSVPPTNPVRQNPLQMSPVAPAAAPRSVASNSSNTSGFDDFLNSSYAKFWDTAFNTRPLNANVDTDATAAIEPEPPLEPELPPKAAVVSAVPVQQQAAKPLEEAPLSEGYLAAIKAGLAKALEDAAAGKKATQAEGAVAALPHTEAESPQEQEPAPVSEAISEPAPEAVVFTPEPEEEKDQPRPAIEPTTPQSTLTHWKPSLSGGAMTVLSDFNPALDRVILALGSLTYTLTEDSGRVALRFSNKDQLRFSNPDMDLTEAAVLAALTFDTAAPPLPEKVPDIVPAAAPKKKAAPRKKAAALPEPVPVSAAKTEPATQPTKAAKKTTPKHAPAAHTTDKKAVTENAADDVDRFLSGDIGFDDLF